MKNKYIITALCSIFAIPAFGAGTYYTGGTYQSPQYRYNADQQSVTQNPTQRYSNYQSYMQQYKKSSNTNSDTNTSSSNNKKGFYLNGGISHETAMWDFTMKTAGSHLHYDNVVWNVLDVNAGYGFDVVKLDAGLKYGMQSGDSVMIDDDITSGGYYVGSYVDGYGDTINVLGHAISSGTSSGGNMLGFNLGIGLPNKLALGKVAITPSIGYRYLSYSLKTNKNYGMAMDSGYCIESTNGAGEIQCEPYIVVDGGGDVDTGNTFYYQQSGYSHKYDVSWSGPYAALDMDYQINDNNSVNARIELGLPAYNSVGDQPYRIDWEHPKSVEDTAGIGGAYHLGLIANYKTAVSKSVSFTIGLTYDYYSVSGANSETNLNGDYYNTIYNYIYQGGVHDGIDWGTGYASEADMLANNSNAAAIHDLYNSCPNWVCKLDNELDSFYKSMGIRIGLASKF